MRYAYLCSDTVVMTTGYPWLLPLSYFIVQGIGTTETRNLIYILYSTGRGQAFKTHNGKEREREREREGKEEGSDILEY